MSLSSLKIDNWSKVLQELENKNTITQICKGQIYTYSHVSSIIELFLKHKFVSCKQDGREKIIMLTDKGMKTIQLIKKLQEQLK